jgi:hypothetical protein
MDEDMHCRFCFKPFARIEKHEAKCEGPTLQELGRVVQQLLERVNAQEKRIAELSSDGEARAAPKRFAPAPVALPVLAEADLKVFLSQGIDAMVAPHAWPVASHNRTTYVCEAGEWVRASDTQLKAVASAVLGQLAQLFPAYVERKGWLEKDPKNLYPEKALKVYGIQPTAVQKALLAKAKA